MTALVRVPTPAEYERLTMSARMAAAQRLLGQIARVEALRDVRARRVSVFVDPGTTREQAKRLAVYYARVYGDTPERGAERLADLAAEAATWTDPSPKRRRTR